MKELTLNERDYNSDFIKGISIIGVLWIHFGLPSSHLFRFCVPLFVCIWAYFLEVSFEKAESRGISSVSYIRKKISEFLIPYLFWTTVYVVFLHSAEEWRTTPIHTIIGGWFGGYGWAGQYFFIIVFQWLLLFAFFRKLVKQENYIYILCLSFLFNVLSFHFLFANRIISGLNDRLFIYWLPFVTLGICFAKGYPVRNPFCVIPGILALLALKYEKPIGFDELAGSPIYFSATSSLASLLLSLSLCSRNGEREIEIPNYVSRAICAIGKSSFSIFVSHNILVIINIKINFSGESLVLRLLLLIGALFFGIFLAWFLPMLKIGILVGKR